MDDTDVPIDKLMTMIKRGILSSLQLTHLLMDYCAKNRAELEKLISVATPADLRRVHDILTTYPWTDVGWSILPASHESFLDSHLSLNERADVERRQYQEDRACVEYLRELIRSR